MFIRSLIIGLVVGESSGDILAAGLIHELRIKIPNIRFVGVAGPLMKQEGCEVWYKMEELTVIGIFEVLKYLPRILKIRKDLIYRFINLKPDIFIGIDAPDFNITLEGYLKKHGIRTIHYVSPSIWAWRKNRIFKISKSTNLVLTFLPFEKKIYDHFNIPCRFIGHAIADLIPLQPNYLEARTMLGINPTVPCLALLPGSRNIEIEMLSEPFLKTANQLRYYFPDIEIIVPLINFKQSTQFLKIKTKIAPKLTIRILYGHSREVMIASNIALLASGTATLECMLAKCPMVVGYRMKSLTFWLAKKFIKIPYISLPNLLAGRKIVTELLQNDCSPNKLTKELILLLENKTNNKKLKQIFLTLHKSIRCNANKQAAQAILEQILL
ncbi:Lipid-A-disaccharide synthase [Serratia symbiotica]|nr:Lipid-A-disaccharide synthase [Serratia symbiotica]